MPSTARVKQWDGVADAASTIRTRIAGMFQRLRLGSLALGELFSAGAAFSVPAFQRPYDWGSDEALQLLDDVSRAAGIDAPEQADPDYFLGTVLLLTKEGSPLPGADAAQHGIVEYQIIDGQQRLTTLTILFAILRDLQGSGPSVGSEGNPSTLTSLMRLPAPQSEGTSRIRHAYRIVLNGADRRLLREYVQRTGSTLIEPEEDAEDACMASTKLLSVREALMANVSQLTKEQREHLATFLTERCHVVVTLSHDLERAHRLFTVLNERGKPLRRNDIVKVEVLGGLDPEDGAHVRRGWEVAEQTLGEDFEAFFGHLKVLHGRKRASVVTGLRSLINDLGGPRSFVDGVLTPYSKVFAQIQACRSAPAVPDDELTLLLYYLGRLRGHEWYPAALAALKVCDSDRASALGLVRGIDRLAHVTRILCHGSGRRSTRFNKVVQAIISGQARDETADVFQFTRDEVRNARFHLRNLYRRNPPVCKLLLMRINDRLSGAVTLEDPRHLSVEHVLPNRPAVNSDWREMYREPDVREAATHCLGNYSLLPDKLNDRLRNRSFAEKKAQIAEYFGNGPMLGVVADVVSAPVWDFATVAAREARFLDVLGEIIGIDVRDAGMGSAPHAAE